MTYRFRSADRFATRRAAGINGRDRRRFLALAASGLVGGLVLRLDREARGAVDSTPRFILYNNANGLQKLHLDKSTVRLPQDFTLESFMTHFEPHKAELTVVQNLYCSLGEYLHGNASSALACAGRGAADGATGVSEMVVGGPTVDQVIADQVSQQERLRSLVLGHPFDVNDGNCVQGTIVGRAKNDPVYPVLDAVRAHELVFGPTQQGLPGQNEVLLARQKSYLDFIKDDINGFQAELPAAERQKLDQYLTSVREIERALAGGVSATCPKLAVQSFGQGSADDAEGASVNSNNPAYWRYMCDLGVAALQCGATRQVTMLHSYGCVHLMYEFDGAERNHHEDVCHTDEAGDFMQKLLGFHAESVAYMYQKLKSVPEGAGTMADSLLMAWMSDGGGTHHNGTNSHAMIYLGKGNGRLKTGQWLRFDEKQHSLASAHLTTAQAMGLDLQTFGDGTDPCPGPLPGLLT